MALPVPIPKDRDDYLHELEVTLALLNQQFEKLEDE